MHPRARDDRPPRLHPLAAIVEAMLLTLEGALDMRGEDPRAALDRLVRHRVRTRVARRADQHAPEEP